MLLEFRKLERKDIPSIKKVALDMPTYFRNIYSDAEYLMDNSNCYFYGAFNNENLCGLGNLRRKTDNFAWIESIRVAAKYQKQGVGLALFEHACKVAETRKFRIIAFATETENKGSNRIGEILGFTKVDELVSLYYVYEDQPIDKVQSTKSIKKITGEKILEKIGTIVKSKNEICMGWDFAPLEKSYFRANKNLNLYLLNETFLLESIYHNPITKDIRSVRAIPYGDAKDIEVLLYDFLVRHKELEYVDCFIEELHYSVPKKLGFQQSYNQKNLPNKVVLWRKKV